MALHRCHSRGVYSGSHIVPQLPVEANHRSKQRCQSIVDIKTTPLKQRAMESVRSAFHAQLATVMDSLLAAAVCEIAKIFESSLCEQQAELAQKTEEISISQSGRCSPRPDPSLAQPGEWLPGLDNTRGGVASLENLQADGTSCSGPASSSTGTDASCFRPGFGSDETSNEDDDSAFPFLDQEPENQNSNQNSVQGQAVGQRGARQVQPQAPSGELPWRPRDDRGGRGPISHARRVTSFGNRDPLRPQSNSQSLTLRHTNTLSHPAAPGGGNGRPYTCPYCTKCFTYPSHQRRHLLRHTGVRLHPCQFCDKSFLTPSELTVHTRTHTGERPFGCAQCGKRFARSGNLRAHQRDVHMGKRPFACTECGKRFAHRGNLRVHNHRVHQGDPYYMDDQQEPDMGPNPI